MENENSVKVNIFSKTPFWNKLTTSEKEVITNQSAIARFDKNQFIGSSDYTCMGMIFVQSGGIRISLLSEEGREITLFRVAPGDCCVTTASCVIKQITFDTIVSTIEKTTLVIIPASVISSLSSSNIYFHAFLYEKESERFSEAIWAMQEMLFKRFDQRLASYLLSRYNESGSVDLKVTQEEIAKDVNSAREVVARMLGRFSDEGLLETKHGHIILKDLDRLEDIL